MDERSENRARILRSVEEWNDWRGSEPSNSPDLIGTKFDRTSLNGANLERCALDDSQFLRAQVEGANFTGASLDGCIFVQVDLRRAVGLGLAQRPDWISFDIWTLSQSRGSIPKVLLQRAGLDGDLLVQLAAPPEYHSCFVSYSSSDSYFVDILVDRLARCGVDIWRDVTHLEPGMPLIPAFEEAVGKSDFLLAVLSEKAVKSLWTSMERFSAKNILPVTLDQAYKSSPHPEIRNLRNRNVLLFENWTHGSNLDEGIKKLLSRLRRCEEVAGPGLSERSGS